MRQVPGRIVGRRQDVGAALPARRRRKQPIGFLAHGLGDAAGLTVRPDDAALFQINPIPFERADFGAAGGKFELQADRQRDDVVLQSFRLQMLQLAEDPHQLVVHDEPGFLAGRKHRDVPARVRAVGAQPPHFGQIEHLAQHAEGAIGLGLLVGQLLHQRGHVRPLHVLHLHPPHDRDDAAVNDALIAALRAGLVALLGVVLHEGMAILLHGRGLAGGGLGRARVAALAHFGQPLLRHEAGLFDGQLAKLAQGRLAALASVRAVLKHEHPAACWGDLA